MNTKNLTYKLILFIICGFVFYSCEIKEIEVGNPQEIQIKELNLQSIKLVIMLPINNPNNFGFRIRKADIDLLIHGNKIGEISKIENINIPKNSNNIYPVYFEIKPSESLTNLMSIINELQRGRPKIEIKGEIKARKLFIYKKIIVEHEQFLDIF